MARIKGSVGTSRGFLNSVSKWTRETQERSEDAFRNGALDFYDELRNATPVLTGNLRDSLVAHVNSSGDETTVTGPNFSGQERSISNISGLKIGDRVSYIYHATYARRQNLGFVGLDSLGRYYNVAGKFWIEAVGGRYRSIMRAAASRLKMRMK